MNQQSIILIFSVLLASCTHTRQFSSYDEIQSFTGGKKAEIILSDGASFQGRGIEITSDSTYWFDLKNGVKQAVSNMMVAEIIITNRERGAWEGFRFFMAAGTALGIAGVLAGDNYGYEGTILVVGLGLGVASGVVLGIPMGAARGSKEQVVFPNKKLDSTSK